MTRFASRRIGVENDGFMGPDYPKPTKQRRARNEAPLIRARPTLLHMKTQHSALAFSLTACIAALLVLGGANASATEHEQSGDALSLIHI